MSCGLLQLVSTCGRRAGTGQGLTKKSAAVRINGTRPVSPEAPLSCPAGDADAALEWPWTARQVPGVYLHEGDPGDWTPRYPVDLGAALNATTTSNATSSAPAFARRAGVCGPEAPTIDLCGVHGGACR